MQFYKREYGSKVKKLCKQDRDQNVWKRVEDGTQQLKVHFKIFAIRILTATGRCSQNKDNKCFRIDFHFIVTIKFHL